MAAKKKSGSGRKAGARTSARGSGGAKRSSTPKKRTGGAKKSAGKRKAAAKPRARRKVSSRRELIDTGTDKRYVRRAKSGQFKESDDVGRSLSADRRRKAKTKAKRGQGDRGD